MRKYDNMGKNEQKQQTSEIDPRRRQISELSGNGQQNGYGY